ncbi:hypothetical protein F3K34_13200 [Streptomyces sp. LBUM 1486]|uniref:hypothetical protein n=1 Tax=Streptomyces scabiei TaxID=1930 RepID=UPI001B322460|nr:hypothetical protein [Streptomyces sp. LBUM 1486]MBP5913191.1 hypothetical protein [Streptomyces sp. LBUM 1486]
MSDALLFAVCFLACWLAAGAAVVVLINRARNRRPYLAARWDEKTGDWADERSDMSLADLDLCNRLWDLPAHDQAEAAITRGLADLFEQLGPPPANEDDNHTTTNPTGDQ